MGGCRQGPLSASTNTSPLDGPKTEAFLTPINALPPLQVVFVHVDTSDEGSSRVTDFFNIEEDDTPTVRLIQLDKEMRKFVPTFDTITAANMEEWVQEFKDGKLQV